MLARSVRLEVVRKVAKDAVLVDLDRLPDGWAAQCRERLRDAGYRVTTLRVEWSRKHWHMIARVMPRPRSLHERIALQLLLGSDPRREANNLRRALVVHSMPRRARAGVNVLYERPS